MRTTPRRRVVSRGRAALLWSLGLFAASQWALGVWLHRRHPDICDPTWQYRIARLKARLAEAPGRPLVVALGSSRVANGFSPADLGDWQPRGRPTPVVFNMATLGGGPVRQLLSLRRLLAAGIHPEWVFAEVWPPFWGQKPPYDEKTPILQADLHCSDLPVLARLYDCGWEGLTRVFSEAFPVIHNRTAVLQAHTPFLVAPVAAEKLVWSRLHWMTLDDRGWLPVIWGRLAGGEAPSFQEKVRNGLKPILDGLEVTDLADAATRELLGECRARNIRVAFLFMPEHSVLRSWYAPRTHALVRGYLGRLHRDYGVPVIDARTWARDEGFQDFSHLLMDGAREFSVRFGPEALRPLLEGAPLPPAVVLRMDADDPGSSGEASPAEPGTVPPGP